MCDARSTPCSLEKPITWILFYQQATICPPPGPHTPTGVLCIIHILAQTHCVLHILTSIDATTTIDALYSTVIVLLHGHIALLQGINTMAAESHQISVISPPMLVSFLPLTQSQAPSLQCCSNDSPFSFSPPFFHSSLCFSKAPE